MIQSSGLKPEEDVIAASVPLQSDFDAQALRTLAKGPRDPDQTRRPLALSVIAAGGLALGGDRDWRGRVADGA